MHWRTEVNSSCPSGPQWWVAFLRGQLCRPLAAQHPVGDMDSGIKGTLGNTKLCGASTCCREGMLCRGTWTGWKGGPMQNSRGSITPSTRSCTNFGAILSINTGKGMKGLRTAFRTMSWECWRMRSLTWSSNLNL